MPAINAAIDLHAPASGVGSGTGAARASATDGARTEEIDEAARAFEKLLVQRMLGDMRRAARGGEDASNAMENWESMFDEEIADVVTRSGGLGFAEALSRSLGGSGSVAVVQHATPTGLSERDLTALRKLAGVDPGSTGPSSTDGTATAMGAERRQAGWPRAPGPHASSTIDALQAATMTDEQAASLQRDFIAPLHAHAQRNARRLGTQPEAILAIAALESGWGRHSIVDAQGADSHNLFGIKAIGEARADGVAHRTTEFIGGAPRRVEATFRRFDSAAEAVDGFADFVLENPRYASALAVADDPEQFLRALHDAGYATDPRYADKVVKLMGQVRAHLERMPAEPDSPATPLTAIDTVVADPSNPRPYSTETPG